MRAFVSATVLLLVFLQPVTADAPEEVLLEGEILLGNPMSSMVHASKVNSIASRVAFTEEVLVRIDIETPVDAVVVAPRLVVRAMEELPPLTPGGSSWRTLDYCDVTASGQFCALPADTELIAVDAYAGVAMTVRVVLV
jgi:hypothetical protein